MLDSTVAAQALISAPIEAALRAHFADANACRTSFLKTVRDAISWIVLRPERIHARHNAAGFIYVQLTFDPQRVQAALRLHLWPAEALRAPPVPHTHSCHLDSLIVCGTMENIDHRVAPGGSYPVQEAFCHAEVCTPADVRAPVHCTESQRTILAQGDRYAVALGQFHSTEVPAGALTATCVLMSRFHELPSLLVDCGTKPLSASFAKALVPAEEIEACLRTVLAAL
jgi:hypothetical protein